jgi:hypothetical protein
MGVCALLLRSVIAPGVMPDPAAAADGVFKLVICTGSGVKLLHGGAPDGSDTGHAAGEAVCPYAASGLIAPQAEALPIDAPAFGVALQGAAQQALAPAAWPHTLGARAPPRLSLPKEQQRNQASKPCIPFVPSSRFLCWRAPWR